MTSYQAYSDEQLIVLLRQDDAGALAELHARYSMLLYAHAYKRYPYREEIRDIVQDLFIYLWDHRSELLITSGLPAYLFTSIKNRLMSQYRKQKVREDYAASFQSFIDKNSNEIEMQLQEKELAAMIQKEVEALSPQMRRIFELSRNQNLSHLQIAEQLGLSPATVRTQVRNALRILRSKLGANAIFLFL